MVSIPVGCPSDDYVSEVPKMVADFAIKYNRLVDRVVALERCIQKVCPHCRSKLKCLTKDPEEI